MLKAGILYTTRGYNFANIEFASLAESRKWKAACKSALALGNKERSLLAARAANRCSILSLTSCVACINFIGEAGSASSLSLRQTRSSGVTNVRSNSSATCAKDKYIHAGCGSMHRNGGGGREPEVRG